MAKKEESVLSEEQFQEQLNSELQQTVKPDSELKKIVVEYIGNKHNPENNEVTLEMAITTFAEEFKEFLLPIAEENFIRGYQQALADVEDGEKFLEENQEILGTLDKGTLGDA